MKSDTRREVSIWYEVDLRRRTDGESVGCIASTDDYEKAYGVMDDWNKANIADYDGRSWEDYIDGTDGLFAHVYHIDDKNAINGIGKVSV